MRSILIITVILGLALSSEIDVNTFSNYLEVQIQHLHLEWLLDLPNAKIDGLIEYTFLFVASGIQKITLDIYQLNIYQTYLLNGQVLKTFIDYPYKESGQGERLNILLDRVYDKGEQLKLRIKYQIDERSRAISFMTKEQTYTKSIEYLQLAHPYLFSQCEDANCRALSPLQDTPAIKQTYSASIVWKKIWDKDINVFMSADSADLAHPLMGHYGNTQLSQKSFIQKTKIPSYLIAIVAGNIVKAPTSNGGRTFVVSEDSDRLPGYIAELKDMEKFLQDIEAYIGPYTWGTYTLVIQPPSFPIGGMENPLLTFANPTIMVGDGSGLGVTIHEMAHSWFGNTVTCVNWSNMWINEGFCVFLERKASFKYQSDTRNPQLANDYVKIDCTTGDSDYHEDMEGYGYDNSFSSLHPELVGVNPDESFSTIPYDKGYQLLAYLESIIGEQPFQQLLKDWIAAKKWQSVDENDFYIFMTAFVTKQPDASNKLRDINAVYKDWVYKPGEPPIKLNFQTQAITDANHLAQQYIDAAGAQIQGADALWRGYLPNQKHIFLNYLIDHSAQLNQAILTAIDTQLVLSTDGDSELLFRWFRACLQAKDATRYQYIIPFLQNTGRGKMNFPVYKALKDLDINLARKTFQDAIKFYHPIARNNLQGLLYG